jgi:hypothetical protein
MSNPERSLLDWVILGLLATLVMTNLAFLILLRTGGPLIGLGFYLVLLALSLRARRRDHRLAMVGGLLGLAVHVVEAATKGWSDYPALVALNLVLPAALALSAWAVDRRPEQAAGDR